MKTLTIILMLVTLAAAGGEAAKIPKGARKYNGHHYARFRVTSGGMSWIQAQEACEKMGGYLVCINDEKEQTWLKTVGFRPTAGPAKNKGPGLDFRIAYIGLYVKKSGFAWVDGGPVRYFGPWVGGKAPKADRHVGGIIYGSKWGSNYAEWRVVRGYFSSAVTYYICEWNR